MKRAVFQKLILALDAVVVIVFIVCLYRVNFPNDASIYRCHGGFCQPRVRSQKFRYFLQSQQNWAVSVELMKNSLDENSLDENSLDENSLDKTSLEKNSLDKNYLDENSLDKNSLDENSVDKNAGEVSSNDAQGTLGKGTVVLLQPDFDDAEVYDSGVESTTDSRTGREIIRENGTDPDKAIGDNDEGEGDTNQRRGNGSATSLRTADDTQNDVNKSPEESRVSDTDGRVSEREQLSDDNQQPRSPKEDPTRDNTLRKSLEVTQSSSTSSRNFPPLYAPVLPNGLDCSRVWEGDEEEVARAMQNLNDTLPARRPPDFYNHTTDNCLLYRQRSGFILDVSKEERKFPLAFSVMVYKEPEQLERLLRAVYRPHNVYCVHADLKTKLQDLKKIRAIIRCLPNVVDSWRQIDVRWGKFSVLEPELICMQLLWRMRSKWKYLINLTGQEFPLKTNKELVEILKVYRGANDILGEPPKERNMWRWNKVRSPPPHNITLAKGPVHIAASRGFVDFLLHTSYARDFLAWTKRTAIPDETYFATLNNQHQLGVPGSYKGNMTSKRRIMLNRFKIWDSSNRKCSGKFVRNICHFGPGEVATLATSRHFIANKFSYEFYPLAYDCLEQWYFDKVLREEQAGETDIDTSYYSNLEIVKYAHRPDNSEGDG